MGRRFIRQLICSREILDLKGVAAIVKRAAVGVVGQGIGGLRFVGVRHTVAVLVLAKGDKNRVILRHIGEGVGGPFFGHTGGEGAAVIGEDLFARFARVNGDGVHGATAVGVDGEGGASSIGHIGFFRIDGAVGPGGSGDVVVIFGDISHAVVILVQAPHCVDRHVAADGQARAGLGQSITAHIDRFAVVCLGPADEQYIMAAILGVGGLEIIGGLQSVAVAVVQAALHLFGRVLTAEISAVGVIGQGALVLVRDTVTVLIIRKGDGDGVVGLDILQDKGVAGIAGNALLPVVVIGAGFHCGIVDTLLHNGDGIQGVVLLGSDGKCGVHPGDNMEGRGHDRTVASINRSGDDIGLIPHIRFAIAVGVIAPYGVDGLIPRRDIHRGNEDVGIIVVIQAVNGVANGQRPAHKGHLYTVIIRMGRLERGGGIQLVVGLRRDPLGFGCSGGRITTEHATVGVIGHGALGLVDIRCPIIVGVVAPDSMQGGILGDRVLAASAVNHAWVERVLHTVDFVYGCLGPTYKNGFFARFIQRNGGDHRGKRDLAAGNSRVAGDISGLPPTLRVCMIRECITARCRIIGISDGQGGLGDSLPLNIPDQAVRLIGKFAVAVGVGGGVPCGRCLRDLIGRAHRQAGDGSCLPGLQLEGSAVPDTITTVGIDRDGIISFQRIHSAYVAGTGVVQAEGIGKFLIWVCVGYVLCYLDRQRPGGGRFGAQAVVAQVDGDRGIVHSIDRMAVVGSGASYIVGLGGSAVGHTAQLGGACFNV